MLTLVNWCLNPDAVCGCSGELELDQMSAVHEQFQIGCY